jgi:4-hydroxybenzoate polyprenyltransferase
VQNSRMDHIRALRPRHWIKNILVLVAPLGAGALTWEIVPLLFLSFLSLSAAASATYLLNDVKDREYDSMHPTKRFRAIASGRLKPGWAAGIALALVAIATLLMVPANFLAFVAVDAPLFTSDFLPGVLGAETVMVSAESARMYPAMEFLDQ